MKETFVSKIYAMQLKVFFCKIFDMKSVGRICTRYFFRKKGNLVDHAWLQTKLGYLCNLQLILYGKPSYSKRWKTKKYQIRWKKGKFHIPQNPSAGQLAVLFLHEKNSLRQWQDNTKKYSKNPTTTLFKKSIFSNAITHIIYVDVVNRFRNQNR